MPPPRVATSKIINLAEAQEKIADRTLERPFKRHYKSNLNIRNIFFAGLINLKNETIQNSANIENRIANPVRGCEFSFCESFRKNLAFEKGYVLCRIIKNPQL